MGEAVLYNKHTSPNQDYDWNAAFNDQEFIDMIFPILIDYVDYSSYLEIPNREFKNVYNYKTVTFHSCYKDIGVEAFTNMLNLTSAAFLSSKYDEYSSGYNIFINLHDIKESAFENCKALVNFSTSVLYNIKRNSFKNCQQLRNFYMSVFGTNLIERLLYNDKNIKIYSEAFINCDKLESIYIPFVDEIEPYAFAGKNFKSAQSVRVGFSFCSLIGSHAFENCSQMSGTFYLNQLAKYSAYHNYYMYQYKQTLISDYAFRNCTKLSEFDFGIVHEIGIGAFDNCENLYSIDLGSKNFLFDVGERYVSGSLIIDSYAFSNCKSLSNIFGGSTVEYIDSHAFENCTALLENKSLGYGLITKISDYAFANCTSLATIRMNQSAYIKRNWSGYDKPLRLEVASTAFYNCSNLTTINLPFAKDIPENMFNEHDYFYIFYWGINDAIWVSVFSSNIYELGSDYLTNIGSSAFANCSNITNIEICCVNTINENAFLNVSTNNSFLVGNRICLNIKTNAFRNVWNNAMAFNTANLSEYELNISSYAFNEVGTSYIELYNVYSISDYAFNSASIYNISIYGCLCESRNLDISSEIFYNAHINNNMYLYNIDNILYRAFYNQNIKHANIKAKAIHSNAFENCSRLSIVTFNNSDLSYIGSNAFLNCSILSIINLSTGYLESIPILEDINAFSDIFSEYKIKVAEKYYNSFIEAPVWSLISDHIESTNIIYDDNIPPYCFYNVIMSSSSITFGSSVCGYIGSHAFDNCTNVEKIVFYCDNYYSNNKVEYIGEYAFKDCADLTDLITYTGKNVSEYAFAGLSNLSYVLISTNEGYLCNISSHAFESCNASTIYIRCLDSIYEYAFYGCSNLKYAELGYNYCKKIGSHAFEGCINLSSMIFNSYGASRSSIYLDDILIDEYAFKDCESLTGITFNGLKRIKTNAFYNCSSFTMLNVSIPTNYISPYDIDNCLLTIDSYAFSGCSNFYVLSDNYINRICSNAFYGTNMSNTYYMGYDLCMYIDDYAFNGTSISNISCLNYQGYSYATANNDMTRFKCRIGSHAFDSLSNLQQITIYKPESINDSQFISMSTLKSVSINICDATIYYNTISTTYKDLLFDIGASAFKDCENLSYTNIKCVKTIKSHAFDGCTNLGCISYNNSIGYHLCFEIEDYAFSGCLSLSSLTLNTSYFSLFGNPTDDNYYINRLSMSSNAFKGMTNLYSISLDGCGNITSHLFENLSKLSYVLLSCISYGHVNGFAYSAMIDIGEYAFAGCSSITQLYCSYIKTIKSHAFENFYMPTGTFVCGMSLCNEVCEYAFNSAAIQYVYLNEYWTNFQSGSLVQCSIASNAFINCSFSTLWIFNVKTINNNAFNNTYISNLNISAITDYSLRITKDMFSNVIGLTNLNLEFIYYIESGAFSHSSTLSNLYISMVSEIGEEAFYDCSQLYYLDAQLVNKVGSRAFKDCSNLNYVTAIYGNNSNDRRIEEEAFMNCTNLACSAYAPMHNYIGKRAYYNTNVYNVYMPNATYIGESAFANNNSLDTLLLYSVETIESYAFYNCSKLSSLVAAYWYSCRSIGSYAFYNNAFSSLRISSPVLNNIDEYAFNSCSNLSVVYFNESISYIGTRAFANCESLTQIYLSADIYDISNQVFADCINLSMIIIGNSINIIPNIRSIDVFDNISTNYSIFIYSDLYSLFIEDSIWNLLSDHFSIY